MQPAAMNPNLRVLVTGKFSARFLKDELSKPVEEAAFNVLNSVLQNFACNAKGVEFPHGVRQQGNRYSNSLISGALS